ncbi:TetR family transcriptional regulator [Ruania sp. N2-46]|uniref:TetR family transcriptional regulator n=1 Tax=Occultella gossypii TaxID=2800820 RepID=A0ABS7SB25_9MICO|nr:TetR family transcriptional regulator [Occultella gossypii]
MLALRRRACARPVDEAGGDLVRFLQSCKNARVQETSLRERKRAETWGTLHETAAAMVLEDGLGAVTVDAIAARANVSTRTFFNYFPTKEHAVVGLRRPHLDPATRQAFLDAPQDGQLLKRTTRLLLAVARTASGSALSRTRRRDIFDRHPELVRHRTESFRETEAIVTEIVTDRIALVIGHEPDEPHVRMLISMASAALTFAATNDPTFILRDDVDGILDDAVDLLREVVQKS